MAAPITPFLYRRFWPLLRLAPAEWTHALGLSLLRAPLPLGARVQAPFTWRGLRFENRVGIAAGFDKNAAALRGLNGLGAGFVEVGSVLLRPHQGRPPPRLTRLEAQGAIWNRLGFPSDGLPAVRRRLKAARALPLRIACNIAPHPATVRRANSAAPIRAELIQLAEGLHEFADLFVVNLSSPNTAGLRALLHGRGFADDYVAPLAARIAALDSRAGREIPTPLLVKLPPEDSTGKPWRAANLDALLQPLLPVCDGFVAVNSSATLALRLAKHARPEAPGGISGAPLHAHACALLRLLKRRAPEHLLIGCGGVLRAADATAMLAAGAHLVELYSGLVYRGPSLVAECAEALAG